MNGKNKRNMTVSALVPLYNEETTITTILKKLIAVKQVTEIILVDDGSTDRSLELALKIKSKKLEIFKLEKNSGKTAAIQKAITEATGDIIFIQDADLEYDPEEIESLIEPIINGFADVVYGSRFMVKKASRVLYFYHYLANKFLTLLSNTFTNRNRRNQIYAAEQFH